MRMFAGMIVEADGDPELRQVLVSGTHRMQTAVAEMLGGEDAARRARLVLATLWGIGLYDFVMRDGAESATWDSLMAILSTMKE